METKRISGMVDIPHHVKRINLTTEALPGDMENRGFKALAAHATLDGGSNQVAIAIRNVTQQKLVLKKGTVVGTVSATNVVPPMPAPHLSTYSNILGYVDTQDGNKPVPEYTGTYSCVMKQEHKKPELTDECSDKLFSKLDLSSLESWSEVDQQKAVNLLKEYHHLFALDNLELGCTSQVKHKIRVMDPVPYKQRYHRIPLNQFE